MIWLLIAIIGAGTFIFSGFSVLTDPFCQSVDFGGSRVIQMTCRDDTFGAFSKTSAGWLSILGGIGILLFIFRRPLLKALSGPNYPKVQRTEDSSFNSALGEGTHQVNLESQGVTTDLDPQEISQGVKKCKFCAEPINIEAIKCKHCGSSLVPNSTDKINAFLKSDNGKIVSVISLCLLLVIGGFLINDSNNKKELLILNAEIKQLNSNGQICAYGDENKTENFGCYDYPNAVIGFCSSAKVLNPFWAEESTEWLQVEGANELGQVQGSYSDEPGFICSDTTYPNFFTFKWKTDFRIGTYRLLSLEYAELGGYPLDENSNAASFYVEVSIKK